MIEYEVTLEVDPAIAGEYVHWLRGHVEQMLALPGFVDAAVLRIGDPTPASGWIGLCVRYRLRDEASLAKYLHEHATRMRADAIARFGE